ARLLVWRTRDLRRNISRWPPTFKNNLWQWISSYEAAVVIVGDIVRVGIAAKVGVRRETERIEEWKVGAILRNANVRSLQCSPGDFYLDTDHQLGRRGVGTPLGGRVIRHGHNGGIKRRRRDRPHQIGLRRQAQVFRPEDPVSPRGAPR